MPLSGKFTSSRNGLMNRIWRISFIRNAGISGLILFEQSACKKSYSTFLRGFIFSSIKKTHKKRAAPFDTTLE
jgi:hypothetical protein